MAIAWKKAVFLFRDDFRRCTDSEAYPLNLMVFTGLPEMGWEDFWYGSVGEIADPRQGARTLAERHRAGLSGLPSVAAHCPWIRHGDPGLLASLTSGRPGWQQARPRPGQSRVRR